MKRNATDSPILQLPEHLFPAELLLLKQRRLTPHQTRQLPQHQSPMILYPRRRKTFASSRDQFDESSGVVEIRTGWVGWVTEGVKGGVGGVDFPDLFGAGGERYGKEEGREREERKARQFRTLLSSSLFSSQPRANMTHISMSLNS